MLKARLPIIAEKKGSERMNCSVGQTASPPPSHTGCAITLAALLHGCRTKARSVSGPSLAFHVSCVCSPLFMWVGVLLVYMSLTATPALSHLCVVSSLLRYARRRM